MVFLKGRPFVKRNNAKFTNVSSFTLLLMCGTHFTLSCRILHFSLPTANNFFKFVYSEITGESAWWVQFRPPWCCLLLWQLKFIRTGLTSILDFCYLCRKFLYFTFLFVFSVLNTKNSLKRAQFSRYNTAFFDHFTVFLRTE